VVGNALQWGARGTGGTYSNYFNGWLDEVAVWNNTVLNQTDILKFWNGTYHNYKNTTIVWENMTILSSGETYSSFTILEELPLIPKDMDFIYYYKYLNDQNITQILPINMTIKNFYISTTTGTPIINILFRDEKTRADISTGMYMESIWTVRFLNGGTQTFSLNTTGATTFYINPTSAVVQADVEFKYSKTGYRQRTHYLINSTLSTSNVNNLQLYTISDATANSTAITFTLINYNREILPDYYLDIQRWYVDLNGYSTISLSKMDVEAKSVVFLEPYTAFYRMLVYDRNGALVYTASRQVISQSEIEIQLSSSLPSNTFDKFRTMQYTYSENKTTGLVATSLVDTSGSQFSANMVVKRLGIFGGETICNSSGYGSATALSCNVPTNTTDEYAIKVDVTKGGTTFPLLTESLNYKTGDYGIDGVVSAFLIIGTLAFMGLGSPHMAILTTILGIGISVALGLLVTGVASFIGLIVVGIAMLMVMRK
jgi:hypothetical protein